MMLAGKITNPQEVLEARESSREHTDSSLANLHADIQLFLKRCKHSSPNTGREDHNWNANPKMQVLKIGSGFVVRELALTRSFLPFSQEVLNSAPLAQILRLCTICH